MKHPRPRRSTPGKPAPPRAINAPAGRPRPVNPATGSTHRPSTYTPPLIALQGGRPKPPRLTSPPAGRPAPGKPPAVNRPPSPLTADVYLVAPDAYFIAISLQRSDGTPLGKIGTLCLDRNHLTGQAFLELGKVIQLDRPAILPGESLDTVAPVSRSVSKPVRSKPIRSVSPSRFKKGR